MVNVDQVILGSTMIQVADFNALRTLLNRKKNLDLE